MTGASDKWISSRSCPMSGVYFDHCLLGPQWISRGFTLTRYLGKGSVPSVYEKPKDSLDTDYPRNEGRLENRFFPRNVLWMFLWDPL